MNMLEKLLAHPLTRGLPLDDPRTTRLRRRIIQEKPFLKRIYDEWYEAIAATLPAIGGPVLELGAGAGFLRDKIPGVITSEIFGCPEIDVVLDALSLPIANAALRAIVMIDVLHHLPQPQTYTNAREFQYVFPDWSLPRPDS